MLNKLDYMQAWTEGQANLAFVNIDLAKHLGADRAIILYKIMFFCRDNSKSGKVIEGARWVYNTYAQWKEEHFPWLSDRTLRRYILDLEDRGLLLSKQLPGTMDKTKYYRPNSEAIYDMLMSDPVEEGADLPCDENRSSMRPKVAHELAESGHMLIKETVSTTESTKELLAAPISKKVKPVKPAPEPRPRDLMFDIVAEVTKFDPKLTGSRIAKASNALKKAGYTSTDVATFLQWWKQYDFRWKQSKQLPLPEDIINLIARSKSSRTDVAKDDTTSLYPADYIPGETLKEYTERINHVTH